MGNKTLSAIRTLAFLLLTAVIVVMASERVYWYFTGYELTETLGTAAFYALPVAVALLTMGLVRAHRAYQIVLAGGIFAVAVEGILTSVVYGDGPLPVFALMFLGWHGLLAFVGFWYLCRKWLLERRLALLATAAGIVGLYWGVWAYASTAGGEEDAELGFSGGLQDLLSPDEFAAYAVLVALTLALAHWAIGFVWPKDFVPSRTYLRVVVGLAILYFAVVVVPVVIWAPIKLAVLFGGAYWLMRRAGVPSQPTLIARLHGRIRLRDTAAIAALPLGASASYSLAWHVGISETTSTGIYELLAISQVFAGLVALVWAIRRSRRSLVRTSPQLPVPSNVG